MNDSDTISPIAREKRKQPRAPSGLAGCGDGLCDSTIRGPWSLGRLQHEHGDAFLQVQHSAESQGNEGSTHAQFGRDGRHGVLVEDLTDCKVYLQDSAEQTVSGSGKDCRENTFEGVDSTLCVAAGLPSAPSPKPVGVGTSVPSSQRLVRAATRVPLSVPQTHSSVTENAQTSLPGRRINFVVKVLPQVCPYCSAVFMQPGNLTLHMKHCRQARRQTAFSHKTLSECHKPVAGRVYNAGNTTSGKPLAVDIDDSMSDESFPCCASEAVDNVLNTPVITCAQDGDGNVSSKPLSHHKPFSPSGNHGTPLLTDTNDVDENTLDKQSSPCAIDSRSLYHEYSIDGASDKLPSPGTEDVTGIRSANPLSHCDTVCSKTLDSSSALRKRRKLCASFHKQKLCGRCYRKFSLAYLPAHKRMCKGKGCKIARSHVCDVCGKTFLWKMSLRVHMHALHGSSADCVQQYMDECKLRANSNCEVPTSQASLRTNKVEKPFVCHVCGKVLASLKSLQTHELTHRDKKVKPYSCSQCNQAFSTKCNLRRHQQVHTEVKPFHCEFCQKSFTRSSALKSHLDFFHLNCRPFVCQVCNKGFSQRNSLTVHMRVHLDERPFTCDVCEKAFKHASTLKEHKKLHSSDRPFKCNKCGKSYITARSLAKHTAGKHSDPSGARLPVKPSKPATPCVCHVCGKVLVSLKSLQTHELTHMDKKVKPYLCSQCNQAFATKGGLRRHRQVHTEVKPFHCECCQKSFTRSAALKSHLDTFHLNSRPHVCHVCNKGFSQRNSLNVHMRVHLDARPFACDMCEKAFKYATTLKAHRKLHSSDRPFKCNICGESFISSFYLARHTTRKHSDPEYICDVCAKGFPFASELSRHKAVHADVTPYPCSVCGKVFKYESSMRRHKLVHDSSDSRLLCENPLAVNVGGGMSDESVPDHANNTVDNVSNTPVLTCVQDGDGNVSSKPLSHHKAFSPSGNNDTHLWTDSDTNEVDDDELDKQSSPCASDNHSQYHEYFTDSASDKPPLPDTAYLTGIKFVSDKLPSPDSEDVTGIKFASDKSPSPDTEDVTGIKFPSDKSPSPDTEEVTGIKFASDKSPSPDSEDVTGSKFASDKSPSPDTEGVTDIKFASDKLPSPDSEDVTGIKFVKSLSQSQCETMSSETLDSSDALRKLKNMHAGFDKQKLCKRCCKKFSLAYLPAHKRMCKGKVCKRARSHQCDVCGKAFLWEVSLRVHMHAQHGGSVGAVTHKVEKPCVCHVCGKVLASLKSLQSHELTHRDKKVKPYSCRQCNQEFASRSSLRRHQLVHTGVKPFHCEICQKSFTRSTALQNHVNAFHLNCKPHICHVCNKSFSQRDSLNVHMRIHSDERPFICDTCEKAFKHASTLKEHKKLHSSDRSFKCNSCDKSYSTAGSLAKHTVRKHSDPSRLPVKPSKPATPCVCLVCGKVLASLKSLQSHELTHSDKKVKPYSCSQCNQAFATKCNLRRHQQVHTEVKPFHCELCQKSFTRSAALKSHLDTFHLNCRPYVCHVCSKGFSQRSSLNVHMRIHLDERPFACDVCEKAFKYASTLKEHKKLHSSDRPFTCNICGESCITAFSLARHTARKHSDPEYICNVCAKGFHFASELSRHQAVHADTIPYPCSVCSKVFKYESSLKRHKLIHDSSDSWFMCIECGKGFGTSAALKQHVENTHSDVKP